MNIEFHGGVEGGEFTQYRRQAVQANMVAGSNAQAPTDRAPEPGNELHAVGQLVDDALCGGNQCLAGFGQLYAPAATMEQARV